MVKNKRAWLRIMEAVIGIMIITSVLVLLYAQKTGDKKTGEYIYDLQSKVLIDIGTNPDLRDAVLGTVQEDLNYTIVNDSIDESLPDNLGFKLKICNIGTPCPSGVYPNGDVYVEERVISSNLEIYAPKLVRLFIWEA